MQPFIRLDGRAAPLAVANVDTDQIIPKQFLKTVEREGLGRGLFYDFRFNADGSEIPDFVLNRPEYKGSSVLVALDNFGCGSSREHAPWALMDFGFTAVIAPSFAEIFNSNCLNNGLLPVVLPEAAVHKLLAEALGGNHLVTIDLPSQTVTSPSGEQFHFEIDPVKKDKLLKGLDAIGETLEHRPEIEAFETRLRNSTPWTEKTA
ncbi:MAG: leuD [Caulobacteraceae bacterium]|nr:leuD [Caulobacteraceae bacterium]